MKTTYVCDEEFTHDSNHPQKVAWGIDEISNDRCECCDSARLSFVPIAEFEIKYCDDCGNEEILNTFDLFGQISCQSEGIMYAKEKKSMLVRRNIK